MMLTLGLKVSLYALSIILGIAIIAVKGESGDEEMITNQSGNEETIVEDLTNEGNEFFVGFIRNRFGGANEQEMIDPVLWITTSESTSVSFNVSSFSGLLACGKATHGEVTYIDIPIQFVVLGVFEDNATYSKFKGIHIKAEGSKKIIVFGHHEEEGSNDAYLALPIISLPGRNSYEYIVASVLGDAGTVQEAKDSVALIIGTENDTELTIEASTLIFHVLAPRSLFLPNTPTTVTIQKFQTFYLEVRGGDISGTRITANKPISVFSGHECANIPLSSEPCDMLIEQLPPVDTWGIEVAIIPLRTRVGGDVIKVFALYDSTIISVTYTNLVNGAVTSGDSFVLNRNGFRELDNIEDFTLMQSNYPIAVFQFSRSSSADNIINSDPFMLSVPPLEQYRNSYVVAPAPFNISVIGNTPTRVAYVNYTNIAVPSKHFNSSLITINNNTINASEFKPIRRSDNSTWGYGAQLLLNNGTQVIKHENTNAAILVTIYGFSNQMSWGCAGGTGLTPISLIHSVTVIALNPEVVAQLLIVDCSSDVPSTRNQTIGQSLILRCNVNIVRPIMNTELVNFKWSSNNKTLMMTDQIGQTQDHYVISQLNTSNDGQEYECEVMIRSTPPETESGAIVLDISVPNFNVDFDMQSEQENIVGDSYNIQCIARVPFNGIEPNSVIFKWWDPTGISITNNSRMIVSPTIVSADTYSSYLQFSYLMEGDEGNYTCSVQILKTNRSSRFELRRLIVPTPSVNLVNHNTTMTVGQALVLECLVTTVRGVNSPVTIVWNKSDSVEVRRKDNVGTFQINYNSAEYKDFFTIPLLTTDDNDVSYECIVIISDVQSGDMLTLRLNVPIYFIAISPNGSLQGAMIGSNQTIQCTITTVNGVFLQSVMVTWIGPVGISITNNSRMAISSLTLSSNNSSTINISSSLQLMNLMEGDEGRYVCDMSILQTTKSIAVVVGALIGDNVSDRSTSSWIIVGISTGVILLITSVTTLLCLLLRKRKSKNKTLKMKAADLDRHPINNPTYDLSLRSIAGISKPKWHFSNLIVSSEEWKKELAGCLIDYNSLDIENTIASGKFGIVYKASYTSKEGTKIEVAVKTVKYFSSQTAENFIKECNIANKFNHPNVLSLIGVCVTSEEDVPLMVMPYMHHGDVRSFLKSKRENNIKVEEYPPGLSKEILTKMCYDVAKGMEYLAIKHFVHRDLAARNCMLDQSMKTKVADFGLSRDVYVTEYYTMSHSIPLPVKWLAPEALFDRYFNEKTDVWAFGVTCWEVFSLGLQPYPLIGPSEIGDYIKSGKILDKPQLSSDEMYEIMTTCWKFEADKRPNFSDLVKGIECLISTSKMAQSNKFIKKESTAYLPVYS